MGELARKEQVLGGTGDTVVWQREEDVVRFLFEPFNDHLILARQATLVLGGLLPPQ